jgi:hypothetical protein
MEGLARIQEPRQQPKEVLFVLTFATVNVEDALAETTPISTSSLDLLVPRQSEERKEFTAIGSEYWSSR